jgi:gliding motility-associated-like protein
LSNTLYFQINDLPTITINPADTFINSGTNVSFRTNVTGVVASFEWQPADKLEDALILSPTTISLTADQSYSLRVASDKGCTSTKEATIKILYPLNMPSAFTPNGDGLNDVFRIPPHVSINLKEFSIYDRWGNKVFTTQDVHKGWDGTLGGQPATPGVYIYTVTGSNEKGNVFVKGTVLLLR